MPRPWPAVQHLSFPTPGLILTHVPSVGPQICQARLGRGTSLLKRALPKQGRGRQGDELGPGVTLSPPPSTQLWDPRQSQVLQKHFMPVNSFTRLRGRGEGCPQRKASLKCYVSDAFSFFFPQYLPKLLKVDGMPRTGMANRKSLPCPLPSATRKPCKYLKLGISPGTAEGFRMKTSINQFV